MISVNARATANDLAKFKEEFERKLTGMLHKFVHDVTVEAIDDTPHGDLDNDYKSGAFETKRHLYEYRHRLYNRLQVQPGLAKGNWYVTTNTDKASFDDVSYDDIYGNLSKMKLNTSLGSIVIGDTIHIANPTPYMVRPFGIPGSKPLEAGYSMQAPEGISKPVYEAIFNVYQLNLKNYYDES